MRQQGRTDVRVYGVNGNAQAIENIKDGFMTATAWEDSFTEGHQMVNLLGKIKAAGASWKPEAVEVPAVLVTQANVGAFIKAHPDALGK
jgi:ribose transport system substrate-binding protein